MDSKHIDVLYNQAVAYKRTGDVTRAKNTYKEILAIMPEHPEVLMDLGSLYLNEASYNEAKECFLNALKSGKYLLETHLALSKVYMSLYDLVGCAKSCRELLKILNLQKTKKIENMSDLGNLYVTIGNSLSKKQENLKAKLAFEIANQLSPLSNDNQTLSLCMIVKDEESFLPKCLNSVKDHVDEIIIVDTGSTDNTIKIANSYGAKIFHHAWEDSFSKARNISLKYATCDWILILDADEEVDKEDARKLRDVIRDNIVNMIYLPVFSKFNKGKDLAACNSERIFRNHLGFYYEGIVHNSLKHADNIKRISKKTNIKIYHYGYDLNEEQMEKKFIRSSKLLREQINTNPEDPKPHYYLSNSYLERNMYKESINEALVAIRLFESQGIDTQLRALSYKTAGTAFFHIKDMINAEDYALKAIGLFPDYVDAHFLLSSIYLRRKEYGKCMETSKTYLMLLRSIEADTSTVPVIQCNNLHHAWLAYSRMAIIYFEQGKAHDGDQALSDAVTNTDKKWEPYDVIGKHFKEQGNIKMAEKFYKVGLELKHIDNNKS